jgi:hypothetical protein
MGFYSAKPERNPMNYLERARQQVKAAQESLDKNLREGVDTTDARKTLELAQSEVARLAADAEKSERPSDTGEVAADAQSMVEQAVLGIQKELSAMMNISIPEPTLYSDTARELLKARKHLEQAQAAWSEHRANIENLRRRKQVMLTEQGEISLRRQSGEVDDAVDGPRLALLQADIDGLTRLIEQAKADSPENPDLARQAVQRQEKLWAESIGQARTRCLLELTQSLEAALLECATALKASVGLGGDVNRRWQPSIAMRDICSSGIC